MNLDKVKELLKEEIDLRESLHGLTANVMPILHNDKLIMLQFSGWCINLREDGTWNWEDTTGG